MGWTSASAHAVPSADRFDWFCDTVSNELMPVTLRTEHRTDFHARITDLDLGLVRVSTFAFSPVLSRRTAAHVRRGDPEQYQLAWVTGGAFRITQLGHESLVEDGLVLTDTSRPMENTSFCEDGQATRAVVLQIPRTALALRSDRVDRLLARRIPAVAGTGAVLTGFLTTLLDHGPDCGPVELRRMGSVVLDLATACLAQQLGAAETAPVEARAQVLLQRVLAFIEDNLGDPGLTPRAIAAHHNVSVRTLYDLFRTEPSSIAASIRHRRLERCRTDLGSPHLGNRPVHAIAARWGFTSATVFSRAFRDAYGVTPREYRAAALHPTPADLAAVTDLVRPRTG